MTDSTLFAFFNEFPILPVSIIFTHICGFLPMSFILYIAQIAPLHSNCRYILCIWALGFGASFVGNLAIAKLDMESRTGYMPMDLFEPRHFIFYKWYTICGTFTVFCEILLSMERMISIIHPTQYHFSTFSWKTLSLLTTSMVIVSFGVDHFVHNEEYAKRLVGTLFLGVIEVSVLVTGITAATYCRITYQKMYRNATLIKRYQTKEAYEMSQAMIPAYIASFTVKASGIVVLYVYFALDDMSFTGYAQDYLILMTAANGIFSMVNLLCKHPQLRIHAMRKLRNFMRMKPVERKRTNSVAADTDVYFSMYSASWK